MFVGFSVFKVPGYASAHTTAAEGGRGLNFLEI